MASSTRLHALFPLLWLVAPLFAQQTTTLVEPPLPLLPRQFSGWQRTGDLVTNLAQADAPYASILKEDGVQRSAQATYARDGGSGSLTATALQFSDATGAYSAFTFFRSISPNARPVLPARLGSAVIADGDGILLLAGTTVLRTSGQPYGKEIAALAAALPKIGGPRGLAPLLPTYLPAEGLQPESVRYALGASGYRAMGGVLPPGILSFDKSLEAATASYTGRSGSHGDLTLLLYPTPELAGQRGHAIEQAINQTPGRLGTVRLRRIGPLLGLTSGSLSPAQAQTLTAALHLNSELTFDKKMPLEFHTEVRKTASLLENIAVFSGVLGAAAVLLGLFLGGARAGIRVLQGKPAATEPEFLTINLRDQPRVILAASARQGES